MDILLDERDFEKAIKGVEKFATDYNLDLDGTSHKLIEVIETMLVGMELNVAEIMCLTRLIYNIQYRI